MKKLLPEHSKKAIRLTVGYRNNASTENFSGRRTRPCISNACWAGSINIIPSYWGAYTRRLDPEEHTPGKRNTQKIERKHLTLRTRMKRLVRKTICFSKSTQMHDIVIGLFVNRCAFGRAV